MKKILFTTAALSMCLVFSLCSNSRTDSGQRSDSATAEVTAKSPLVTPDLTFFELQGPVKKVTVNKNTYEFDNNGNLTKVNGKSPSSFYSRDEKRRIVSENADGMEYVYFWDSKRPTGYTVPMIGDITFTYDERGFRTAEKSEQQVEGCDECRDVYVTYTYGNTDAYGNWLSRSNNIGEKTVRKIEYYAVSGAAANDNSVDKDLTITKSGVGPFAIGAKFPAAGPVPGSKLTIKRTSRTEIGEGEEYTVVIDQVMFDNETVMELVKDYDANTINEIKILSTRVKTAEGIGVGSTIETFFNTYSSADLGFTYISGLLMMMCDEYESCQFLLSELDFKYDLTNGKYYQSDYITLKPSDFKPGAKIVAIRRF